jgi:hypothetical protein
VLITNHVFAGALIGTVVPHEATAFGLGVASHFALDMVPHWGNDDIFLKVAVVDGLVGLTALGLIARSARQGRRAAVVAGMLGSCLPDADKPSKLFFGRSPFPGPVDQWHMDIQRESVRRMPQELLVAGLGALALRAVRRRLG